MNPTDSNDSANENVVDLQIKVTFLEDTLQEINKVVYQQQKTMDQMMLQIQSLKDQILEIKESADAGNLPLLNLHRDTGQPYDKPSNQWRGGGGSAG